MIKAVIFDMDGVLINCEPIYIKKIMEFFKRVNVTPNPIDLNHYIGQSDEQSWAMLINDSKKRVILRNQYAEHRNTHPIPFEEMVNPGEEMINPGVESLLQTLKKANIKMALASAGPMTLINYMLDSSKIRQHFDVILSGESLTNNKPAPDIYIEAAKNWPFPSQIV